MAIAKRLCIKVGCTTCGAMEFRRGLHDRAARAVGLPIRMPIRDPNWRYDERIVSEWIRQLSLLTPNPERGDRWFHAVCLIFFDVWRTVGTPTAERVYQPVVEGTWAGSVLRAMQEHFRHREEACRQHEVFHSREVVEARRADKRRLKQQAHAERLARKKERDRLWFEQHPPN